MGDCGKFFLQRKGLLKGFKVLLGFSRLTFFFVLFMFCCCFSFFVVSVLLLLLCFSSDIVSSCSMLYVLCFVLCAELTFAYSSVLSLLCSPFSLI